MKYQVMLFLFSSGIVYQIFFPSIFPLLSIVLLSDIDIVSIVSEHKNNFKPPDKHIASFLLISLSFVIWFMYFIATLLTSGVLLALSFSSLISNFNLSICRVILDYCALTVQYTSHIV